MAVSNPRRRRRSYRRRYRRNPRRRTTPRRIVSFRGIKPVTILWNTLGLVGTQTLTPMLLQAIKQPATGPIALLGKAATAMLGAWGLSQAFKNREIPQAWLQGGLISVATDLYNTYVKPQLGLGGYYEFGPGEPGVMGGRGLAQYYMTRPMDQALLGEACPTGERYLAPLDEVVVGSAAGPRHNVPPNWPERYAPAY